MESNPTKSWAAYLVMLCNQSNARSMLDFNIQTGYIIYLKIRIKSNRVYTTRSSERHEKHFIFKKF